MKIVIEIKSKEQLDAVYFAYDNPVKILNLIGQDKTNWDDISIDELILTVRSSNVLKNEEIMTVGQLLKLSYWDIYRYPNMGRKSCKEIVDVLASKGLKLRGAA